MNEESTKETAKCLEVITSEERDREEHYCFVINLLVLFDY
jgi:hypothetical protein